MAVTFTSKYIDSDGDVAAATKTSTSQSFAAGTRVMVVGHALRNGHSAGLGANWTVTDSATTNDPTWTELAFSPQNNWSATFELQSALLISSELTATESFTVTVDASSGTGDTFYYVLQVFEVSGSNGALVQAGAGTATTTTTGTPTLGAAPTKTQLIIGTALCSGDSITWAAAPTNFAVVSGSTVTPVGGMSASMCSSTTNTATGVTWSWSHTETTLATNMLLVELDEAGSATVEQSQYRFGLDDGNETGHTFAAAQGADITAPTGETRLARFLLQTTGDPGPTAYTLRHALNGGGYTQTPVGATVPEAFGTVTFGAIGTGANGTTTVAPSYPTGITAGQYLLCEVTSGATNSETPTTPSGWTLLATGASTDGTFGVDAGPRRATVFGKVADGTETGTLTVSITNGNTCRGTITRWTKTGGDTWDVVGVGGNDSTSGTGVSITFASVNWHNGDAVEVVTGQLVDGATQSAQSLTATGITFGTRTNRAATAVTTGNDIRHTVDTFAAVTNADPSEDAAPTWAYTASAAASAGGVLVRLRAYTAPANNPVYIAPSANITAGGEATTSRLTGGTGTFTTGRRWDDENGTDTIDIGADGCTEVEWAVATQGLTTSDTIDLRVYAGAAALDTYTDTPRWTIGTGGTDYTKTPADSVGATDAQTVVQELTQAPADAAGITDAVSRASAAVRTAADPVGVTETRTVAQALARTPADPVGMTDSVAAVVDTVRAPADAIGASDSASGSIGSNLSDNFNRAAAADLGADWTPVAGGMRIEANTAYAGTLGSTSGVLHRERWDASSLAGPNMAVQGTLAELSTGGYSDLRLMARWSGSTSFYELRVNNAGEWYVNRVTSGGEADIASGTGLTLALPEVWRLEVEGTGATVTLRVYRGGSLLATHGDTTGARITTGTTGGIGGYTAGGSPPDIRIDDWSLSAVAGGVEYDKTPADPVGVTDALSTSLGRLASDAVVVSDAITAERSNSRTVADQLGVSDSASGDLAAGGTNYTRTLADTAGVSDAAARTVAGSRAASDTVAVTDTAARAVNYVRTVADAVAVTDTGAPQTLDIGYTHADTVAVTDARTVTRASARAVADPVGATDSVSVDLTGAIQRNPADPVGLTDSAARVAVVARARADTIAVSDAVTAVLVGAGARNLADPVTVTDSLVVVLAVARAVADLVGVTDAASVPGSGATWQVSRAATLGTYRALLDGVHPTTATIT